MEISVGRNTVWRFLCYKKSKMDGKHELKGLNIYGIACYTICNTFFYSINRPELTHKNLYTIRHNNASAPSELLWMNYIKQLINYITWANSKYINICYWKTFVLAFVNITYPSRYLLVNYGKIEKPFCFYLTPTSVQLIPNEEAEGSPVPQGCFYEAQEQLWPDALPVVTNDFCRIRM